MRKHTFFFLFFFFKKTIQLLTLFLTLTYTRRQINFSSIKNNITVAQYIILFRSSSMWRSVVIATIYTLEVPEFGSGQGQEIYILQKRLYGLWGPPIPLFNGHRTSCPDIKQMEREVDNSRPSGAGV
jgi:hypothetical protein